MCNGQLDGANKTHVLDQLNEGTATVTDIIQNEVLLVRVNLKHRHHASDLASSQFTGLVEANNSLGTYTFGEVFTLLHRTHIRGNDSPVVPVTFDTLEGVILVNDIASVHSSHQNRAVRVYNGHRGVVLCVDKGSYHLDAQSLSSVAYAVLTGIREVWDQEVDACQWVYTSNGISCEEHRHQVITVLNLGNQINVTHFTKYAIFPVQRTRVDIHTNFTTRKLHRGNGHTLGTLTIQAVKQLLVKFSHFVSSVCVCGATIRDSSPFVNRYFQRLPINVDNVVTFFDQATLEQVMSDSLSGWVKVTIPPQLKAPFRAVMLVVWFAIQPLLRITCEPRSKGHTHFIMVDNLWYCLTLIFPNVIWIRMHRQILTPARLAAILLLEAVRPTIGFSYQLVPV
ncbi:hypothetical protein ISREJYDI_CDS0152 [Pseudomonas phage UNO-G1W1]|uniref:Uncharacterized protein n=1 Tax=Pseudomonas phage UNO-G1W1 TaxID=3136609 RepID=A0AAX4QMV7_9CAUD